MSVRSATPADVPAIIEIERVCESAAHWSEEDYLRIWDDSGVSRRVLVAEEADRVSGFLVARHVAGEWELENIAVRPELRGRGMGSELVRTLLEIIQVSGGKRLMLEVRQSNSSARKLYEKHGLRPSGGRPEYYHNPTEDAVLYDIFV